MSKSVFWRRPDGVTISPFEGVSKPVGYTLVTLDDKGNQHPVDVLRNPDVPVPEVNPEPSRGGADAVGGALHPKPGSEVDPNPDLQLQIRTLKGQLTKAKKQIEKLKSQITELEETNAILAADSIPATEPLVDDDGDGNDENMQDDAE